MGRRRRGKSADGYVLSSLSSSRRNGNYASAQAASHGTGSEENILKTGPEGSILKSTTYTVHVDEER